MIMCVTSAAHVNMCTEGHANSKKIHILSGQARLPNALVLNGTTIESVHFSECFRSLNERIKHSGSVLLFPLLLFERNVGGLV